MSTPERTADGRYIIVKGRRWRAQDPVLPEALTAPLLSALGTARSQLSRRRQLTDEQTAALRQRVTWAKEGLGERGTPWWELTEDERLARARDRLERLARRDGAERDGER